ncbi:hypothetical protein BDR07DRAFT_1434027 [Suillus spraguei]|nr:hypothetical protein BDR07DRAFT_1434027 [Suillus spraguei]
MPHNHPVDINAGHFDLDVSGVAGFFGGEEAISAMQTIHLYRYRKWIGWYNSPGSWNVGKKPPKFFELDGKRGPKYVASRSGSVLEHTGHLAYLIMQMSKEEQGYEVPGRVSKRCEVTIIETQPIFKQEETPKEADGRMKNILAGEGGPPKETHTKEGDTCKKKHEKEPVREILPHCDSKLRMFAAVLTIAVSFTTCALCGWTYDWFLSACMSSFVIGSASLELQGVKPAPTAPPGDGMLMDGDDIVLLLGKEENVATITRGKFTLNYQPWIRWKSSRKEKRKHFVPSDGTESANSNHKKDLGTGHTLWSNHVPVLFRGFVGV